MTGCAKTLAASARHDAVASPAPRAAGSSGCSAGAPCAACARHRQGTPLESGTRRFMESRFQHDFSGVRVHTGADAERSAGAIGARAYAIGNDVVFARSRYAPQTSAGRSLLAHELTHVVQQSGNRAPQVDPGRPTPDRSAEAEAGAAALAVARGLPAPPIRVRTPATIAAFSDTGHHVIDEAALTGAGFDEKQREAVERGNLQRDYSQLGRVGNALLLCKPQTFGGYKPEEHFDNFIWDVKSGRWRERGVASEFKQAAPGVVERTPLDYIERELGALAENGKTGKGLVHLGNALHTVEDFFSHSNFVELINGDERFGDKLLTGSVPGTQAASVGHVLESISSPEMKPYYAHQAEAAEAAAPPLSHARIAKDQAGSKYYGQARRLAALAAQKLASNALSVLAEPDPKVRAERMKREVADLARQWLRQPDLSDPWWKRLSADDKGAIDRRLEEAEARTPVTVNQCVFSPLRNMEASAASSIKIPFGVAVPVSVGRNRIWFQAGAGVHQSLPLERDFPDPGRQQGGPAGGFVGAQIVGSFDWGGGR